MTHILAAAGNLHGNGGTAAGCGIIVIGLILGFAILRGGSKGGKK
jgi:hypothetical protein